MDVAGMVRLARQRSGLTQSALAGRARTSAPTISAYEHGTRQPRADVLLRLLEAAGFEPMLVPSSTANAKYVDMFCDALADVVRRNPDVLDMARIELDRMKPSDNVRVWQGVIDAGSAAVIAVLTSRDPDVRGLKADNPFARLGLIDEETRLGFVDGAHGG